MTEQNKIFIAEKTIPVRWTDMDTYEHVNNANYFNYMTEARHDVLIKPFLPNQKETFFLVDVSCEFKRPVQYPDTITAKLYLEQKGKSSFVLSHEFFNSQQELCAVGKSTLVAVDKASLKAVPIAEYLTPLLGENLLPKQPAERIDISNAKLLNTLTIPLRWVDEDAFHHLNNARYFDFMVEARNNLFPHSDIKNDLCLFFLVNTRCVFYQAFYYPANITIKQYLLHTGASSFNFAYQFFCNDEPDVYAEGIATLVCVDKITHRPVAVAKQISEKIAKSEA